MKALIARHRMLIARRSVQLGVLALFIAAYRLDWTLFGVEPIVGNLSASRLFDAVPLSDPFATLQILLAGHPLLVDTLIGAALVVGFYFLVGGRAFCGWVCPVNLVADGARQVRNRVRLPAGLRLERRLKYVALALALGLSALTGVAAFEWISPIALLHRELIFGMGLAWLAVLALFALDLLVRSGWCGHLCPLGAFYALVGHYSPLRVRFAAGRCDRCGVCHTVCPEPQVLPLPLVATRGIVTSGDCTNCGNCVDACPHHCFDYALRWHGRPEPLGAALARTNTTSTIPEMAVPPGGTASGVWNPLHPTQPGARP